MKSAKLQKALDNCATVIGMCEEHGVTVVTVHAWRAKGMPCVVIKGTSRPAIRFVRSEANAWIKKNIKKKEK